MLPEWSPHDHDEGCTFVVPKAVAVGCDHTERVSARRQVRIISYASRSDINPIAIETFELMFVFDLFRLDVAESGVAYLQTSLARLDGDAALKIHLVALECDGLNVHWRK